MIRFQSRFRVEKAKRRPPWKRTRSYQRMSGLADAMASPVKANLLGGLKKFKSKIDPELIYQAWLSGNYERVMEIVPWKSLPDDLSEFQDRIGETIDRTFDLSMEALPAPVNDRLRFDTKNPEIRNYMEDRAGSLVVGIEQDTREFIADAVSRQFDDALTPRRLADIIKPSIGLYPRQVTALMNYQVGLEQSGMTRDRVTSLVDDYHDRLLDYRATMIARTETRLATNEGQQAVWNQAADQGLIPRGQVKRRWIVDGNPCPVCEPMEGVQVGLDEPWTLEYPNGSTKQVMVPTESHPHCMCGMELVYPSSSTEDGAQEG